jgi:hypothetical protein
VIASDELSGAFSLRPQCQYTCSVLAAFPICIAAQRSVAHPPVDFSTNSATIRFTPMRTRLLVVFSTVLLSSLGWGWGREGHQIIAAIAEDHLDETTKVMIQSLIGNNHLYSVASWADSPSA